MQLIEAVSLGFSIYSEVQSVACQGNSYSVIAAPFETQLDGNIKLLNHQSLGTI